MADLLPDLWICFHLALPVEYLSLRVIGWNGARLNSLHILKFHRSGLHLGLPRSLGELAHQRLDHLPIVNSEDHIVAQPDEHWFSVLFSGFLAALCTRRRYGAEHEACTDVCIHIRAES